MGAPAPEGAPPQTHCSRADEGTVAHSQHIGGFIVPAEKTEPGPTLLTLGCGDAPRPPHCSPRGGVWVSGGQSRVPGWTGAQPHRLLHTHLRLHDDRLYMTPPPLEASHPQDSGLTLTPRSCLWLPGRYRPALGPLPGRCLPLPQASVRMEDIASKPVPAGSRVGTGSQVAGSLLPAGAPPVAWLH